MRRRESSIRSKNGIDVKTTVIFKDFLYGSCYYRGMHYHTATTFLQKSDILLQHNWRDVNWPSFTDSPQRTSVRNWLDDAVFFKEPEHILAIWGWLLAALFAKSAARSDSDIVRLRQYLERMGHISAETLFLDGPDVTHRYGVENPDPYPSKPIYEGLYQLLYVVQTGDIQELIQLQWNPTALITLLADTRQQQIDILSQHEWKNYTIEFDHWRIAEGYLLTKLYGPQNAVS